MSPEELIYIFAVLMLAAVTLIRSMWPPRFCVRNPTALAMVLMWCIGRVVYSVTGDGMPIQSMLLQDMLVIVVMFTKPDWQKCTPYLTLRRQFAAAWLERTPWDRAILALFPVAWLFYAPIVGAQFQYWTLYGIGLAQLALAGWEAFDPLLRAIGQKPRADDERPPGLEFAAWERGYG